MKQGIHISLLGRNELAREGLRRILSSEQFVVCSSAADAASLSLSKEDEMEMHIIIVDDAPNSHAIESCRELSERYPNARVVLLADFFEMEEVALAFGCATVDGYIIKEISCEPLIESLKLVALGEKVFPSQLAGNLNMLSIGVVGEDWFDNVSTAGLSEREVEILRCLTMGLANKVVSRRLNISEATVKVHVKAILRKLRVANRTQAAIWAVRHGFENQSIAEPGLLAPAAKAEILEYAD